MASHPTTTTAISTSAVAPDDGMDSGGSPLNRSCSLPSPQPVVRVNANASLARPCVLAEEQKALRSPVGSAVHIFPNIPFRHFFCELNAVWCMCCASRCHSFIYFLPLTDAPTEEIAPCGSLRKRARSKCMREAERGSRWMTRVALLFKQDRGGTGTV